MEKKRIAVVGSGSWGTAISALLAKNGHDITLWSWKKEESDAIALHRENKEFLPGIMLDENISYTSDISCVENKDFVVLVTPSPVVRSTARSMSKYITKGTILVILSKGLEEGSLKTLSQVVEEEIPQSRIVVMSGPSHAEEVARFIPTANVAASCDTDAIRHVQDSFMCEYFRVYSSDDVLGVQLGAALTNVMALCAGVIDGMGFGDNTKAALMTRGIKEISRLGIKMGAKPETFYGLSGIGDLIVTCTSMHSRNRRAGILIGQGNSLEETLKQIHMVVEGVNCASTAKALSLKYGVEMPIINEAYDVLYNNKSPRDAIFNLMCRDKKDEII